MVYRLTDRLLVLLGRACNLKCIENLVLVVIDNDVLRVVVIRCEEIVEPRRAFEAYDDQRLGTFFLPIADNLPS